MENNPYQSPQTSSDLIVTSPLWKQGKTGFCLAMIALIAGQLIGWTGPTLSIPMSLLMFLSVPALLICTVERIFAAQKRLSTWGIVVSIFVMAYLPTMYLSLRHAFRKWAEQ